MIYTMSNFHRQFKDWSGETLKEFKKDRTWWVFCVNDPSDVQAPKGLHDLLEVWWQLEQGHSKHRPHLQGVAHFAFPKGRGQLQGYMKGWWQVMLGTPRQAIAYVTKEDTRVAGPWHHNTVAPYLMQISTILNEEDVPAVHTHSFTNSATGFGPYRDGDSFTRQIVWQCACGDFEVSYHMPYMMAPLNTNC